MSGETPSSGNHHGAGARNRWRGISGLIWLLEHAQDAVTVAVGIVLIALGGVLLVSGIADFLHSPGSVSSSAPNLLDETLLVLILVEIVHTVVLSLRTHQLMAQPFIIIGLVAVIRRILFVLTPGVKVQVTTSELALQIAMIAVFVTALIAVTRLTSRSSDDPS